MKGIFVRGVRLYFTSCLLSLGLMNGVLCLGQEANFDLPKDSYHQSFAPYAVPDILQKGTISKPGKVVTVKVKEITTYEVPVDEDKLKANTLNINDLEVTEVMDSSKINFHQVDCFFFGEVSQIQTKSTESVRCTRMRKGNQYWLSDGSKCVEWQPWSDWDCGSANW